MAGLYLVSHHPHLFRPSTDFIMKVRYHPPGPWHCNIKQDMQLCSSSDLSESMAKGTRLLSTWSRSGKPVHSGGFTGRQTQLLQWRLALLLPWRYICGACQFVPSAQSQQCRSWAGWKPFCSVGSETPGAAQSFLEGFTGGVFSVALLWLFTLLMMGKGGRGSYSFIYPGFLNV